MLLNKTFYIYIQMHSNMLLYFLFTCILLYTYEVTLYIVDASKNWVIIIFL